MPVGLFVRSTRAVGMGAVGYADRSASCVSPPYALLPFFAPKRTAEEAKAVSPDKCREAAAKNEARIPCFVFAVRATCENASESPRLQAESQRCFRWQMPRDDDVSQVPFSERLSEKRCGDFSPHPWGTNG